MAEAAVKEPEKKDTNLSEEEKEIVIPATTTITKAKKLWSMHFIQVKALIKQPKKTHKVTVRTKDGSKYDYKYADLKDVDQAVMDACRQVKDDKGNVQFGYYFDVDNGEEGVSVRTILLDVSGYEKATNRIWFKNYNVGNAQKTAALISYAKRYSLSAAFGIASEDDDDAQSFTQQGGSYKDVDEIGLRIIWQAYVHDHDETAKAWITKPHDPDTAKSIKALLNQYNRSKNAKKAAKKKAEENAKKDQAIKKIVDGKNDAADQRPDSDDGQQDLFNDILGE